MDKIRTNIKIPLLSQIKVKRELQDKPISKNNYNEELATIQAVRIIKTLWYSRAIGDRLLANFQKKFKGQNKEMFRNVNTNQRKEIKITLRERGIYTGLTKLYFIPQFTNLLKIERYPEQSNKEIAITNFLPSVKLKQARK